MRAALACAAIALASCILCFIHALPQACAQSAGAATAGEAGAAVPTPDFTQHRRFQFPVNLGPSAIGIASVQLHASVDKGASWQLYAAQPAHADSFRVQAGKDGEYWFAVRTVDNGGNVRPAGPIHVERIVIVDSRPPQIRLDGDVQANGEVRLKWQVTDPFLDPSSFSIRYQSGVGNRWQPLSVDPQNRVHSENSIGGEYAWTPQVSSRYLTVRIEVLDRAKNRQVETRGFFLPRMPAAVATKTSGAGSAQAHNQNAEPNRIGASERETSSANSQGQTGSMIGKPPADHGTNASTALRPGIPWPIDNQLPSSAGTIPDPDVSAETPADIPPTPPNDGYGRFASDVNPSVNDRVAPEENSTAPATDEHLETSDAADEQTLPEDDNRYRWPEIPPGEPLRMTQSRRFHLEYDIESLGPDVVREVQLWGTQDGGITWEKWNIDADLKSPFDVQVNEEGIYGFRVVIIAANGLAGELPASGSAADLWVGYDATAPTAEITAVLYGAGAHLGKLDIQWTAEDRKLVERPITLAFATSREGPWTTIASALPNTGQYYWELDASVPKQLFLRLQCMDAAGNSCEHTTHEPVNTAGVFPRGRIRGVQPVAPQEPSAEKN